MRIFKVIFTKVEAQGRWEKIFVDFDSATAYFQSLYKDCKDLKHCRLVSMVVSYPTKEFIIEKVLKEEDFEGRRSEFNRIKNDMAMRTGNPFFNHRHKIDANQLAWAEQLLEKANH